ncbi:MAG: DcaP family trimeric outer membrane transporter [Pseudohongiellaceae bacterium]
MIRWLKSASLGLLLSQAILAAEGDYEAQSGSGLLPGAVPGTVRFAGTDTSFGIGGRLETHASVGDVFFTAAQSGRDKLSFSQIPVSPQDISQNQFRFNSRDSRLWLRALHPGRNLDVYVEYDLAEEPDRYTFRLRHAYVSLGPLLAGRSYTTFINSSALPDIDSGTGPGEVSLKRVQLRWTQSLLDDSLDLAVALEEPDSYISDPDSARIRPYDKDQIPHVAARLTRRADWGEFSVASLVRSLRWQQDGQRLDKWSGGIGVSGRLNFGAVDNLRFIANYGNGLGRFFTSGAYADASVNREFSELDPHPVFSAQAAYQHYWSARWRSTLSLGLSRTNLPGSANEAMTARARSAQVNLFWSPVPALTVGFEYLHGHRQLLNGQDGELNRLLFSTRYTLQL